MLALFQWVRSRTAAMVGRVVPISRAIWPSLSSGQFLSSQAIASGRTVRLLIGV